MAPETHLFPASGPFPNSPHPALVYRQVSGQALPAHELHAAPSPARPEDLARFFEQLFAENGWPPAWRNGIYAHHHYHSTAHEVLGVYRGSVRARLGGPDGASLELRAGDVLVIPAGVAHCNEGQSADFAVVGAYPRDSDVDMQRGRAGERPGADRRIAAVAVPSTDPVLGPGAALCQLWAKS